jgi:hypothetical protein
MKGNAMTLKLLKGRQRKPRRVLIYGVPGVGKSTLAASIPDAIMLPTEEGANDLDIDKFETARSLVDCYEALSEVRKLDYKTLVIDTMDWLEKLIWAKVAANAGKDSIGEIAYGKGYELARDEMKRFLELLDQIRSDKTMAIVLLAHAHQVRHDPPDSDAYERWEPRLDKRSVGQVTEWCDEVMFANFVVKTRSVDTGFSKKKKALAIDKRCLYCTGIPTHLAKNRIGLPDEMGLSWTAYADAVQAFYDGTAQPIETTKTDEADDVF